MIPKSRYSKYLESSDLVIDTSILYKSYSESSNISYKSNELLLTWMQQPVIVSSAKCEYLRKQNRNNSIVWLTVYYTLVIKWSMKLHVARVIFVNFIVIYKQA